VKHKKVNINARPIQERPNISSFKRRVFWIATILLPFVVLGTLEGGLRIFHYGGTIPLFVSIPDESSQYYGINLDIAKRYFTKLSDVPTPRKDLFLKEKPRNGYRIFVLGESSAAGFPYGNNITFSRILNRRLSDAFPEKHIEVVNTGLTAINTYTELDFMDEILAQKPDAILIYTGHNEYYGALGVGSMESVGKYRWIVNASLNLQNFRTYQLVRNSISTLVQEFSGKSSIAEAGDPSATLMERIVKKKIIPFGSENYNLGTHQFKENLNEIIRKARSAGVKVLVSELVSNIRDNEPFESVEGSNYPSAIQVYEAARRDELQGKYEEAKQKFNLAKDLDALRFRAPEEFNTIIRTVAAEYQIPVVPLVTYFESHSPHGIIGARLLHEHVHPNVDGYFLMADAFFETLRKENFIETPWHNNLIKPSEYYHARWGMTSLDSVYASDIILRLKSRWPFSKEQRPELTLALFNPLTKIDSLAAQILVAGEQTLEQGHIALARYYEGRGELQNAFHEYRALIYTVPYVDLFYEPAIKVLVEMKNYPEALDLLQDLSQYQQTAFVSQWIGQIYLLSHEISKGIVFLEKARQQGPVNSVLLYNLGRAYFTSSQFEKGNEILGQLEQSTSDNALISKLEESKRSALVH
jgi:lysophospholipase L1-like esterase